MSTDRANLPRACNDLPVLAAGCRSQKMNSGLRILRQGKSIVSAVELVDYTYGGRLTVAGRSMLYTLRAHSLLHVRRP